MSIASYGLGNSSAKGTWVSADVVVSQGGQVIEATAGSGGTGVISEALTTEIATLNTDSTTLKATLQTLTDTTAPAFTTSIEGLQTLETTTDANVDTLNTLFISTEIAYPTTTITPPSVIFDLGFTALDAALPDTLYSNSSTSPITAGSGTPLYPLWTGTLEAGNYILYSSLILIGDAATGGGSMWDYNVGYLNLTDVDVLISSSQFTQHKVTGSDPGVILPITGCYAFNVSASTATTLNFFFNRKLTYDAANTLKLVSSITLGSNSTSFNINASAIKLIKLV